MGDDKDGEKSPSTNKIKINELLCFMQNMIGTIYAPTLTELCSKKYMVEEIKAARDLLYKDLITDNRQPEFEKRIRTKKSDTPSQKFASEIFQLLQENGPCKHMPRYAALDLSKLPVIRYDSTDISGLLISHNKLEKTVVVLTERIKHCTNIIEELAKNQTNLSDSFKEMRDCNTDNHTNNTQNMQPLPSNKMDNNIVREGMDEQIECSECDTKSQNEIDKDAHMSTHREELECSECDYTSYNNSDMKEHISSHEKEFTCSECGNRCKKPEDLIAHMTIHRKTLKCHKCKDNNFFENESKLGEHMLTHMTESDHKPERTDIHDFSQPIMNKKPFSCTECGELFETFSEYVSHACEPLSKTTARKCQLCSYSTINNTELMKHLETHFNRENSYECPKCDFKTTIQYELSNHTTNVHPIENENNSQEDLVSLGGYQPIDKIQIKFNTNVNKSVKEKTYECPSCDYRCSSNAAMKTHMNIHIIPIIYICDVDQCDFVSESKEDFQDHKNGHRPPNDMNYADALKQLKINSQEQIPPG